MRDLDDAVIGRRSAPLDKDQPETPVDPTEPLTRWEAQVMRSGVHMPPREEWPTLLEHLQRGAAAAATEHTYHGRTP